MAITYMTKEGYKKKMEEIAYLESVKRPEISRAIAEARDKGDLSENAEYDAAKEAQGMLEMKISQLKDLVAQARIIDESKLNTDEVQILNKVKIKNVANGMTMEYTIVADSEADLKAKKIASSTPIAQGLLGHKLGEIVEIKVPSGLMKFEIVEISFLSFHGFDIFQNRRRRNSILQSRRRQPLFCLSRHKSRRRRPYPRHTKARGRLYLRSIRRRICRTTAVCQACR